MMSYLTGHASTDDEIVYTLQYDWVVPWNLSIKKGTKDQCYDLKYNHNNT